MSDKTVLETVLSLPSLRCDRCNGYLSSGPVRLMPNGNCIGGCCPAPDGNIQVHRVLPLEAILSQMSFPCKFSDKGCTVMLPFGQTAQHEDKCILQSHVCPVNLEACLWKGPAMEMFKHFEEDHPGYIQQNAEFKINITKIENTGGIFMVAKDSIGIIVKYSYTANDNNLVYDIRHCANNLEVDATSKIKLINDLVDHECSINFKTRKCLPYDGTFYDVENACTLGLNPFFETLDYPDVVKIAIKLVVVHINIIDNLTMSYSLDSLKCGKCYRYLLPPLFNFAKNVVCYKCGTSNNGATPSSDTNLTRCASETKFPCIWRNCDFAAESYAYKTHEVSCKFRLYTCHMCKQRFKVAEAIAHYKNSHKFCYLPDKISFACSMSFNRKYYQTVFTIKRNEFIGIYHSTVACRYHMSLFTSFSSSVTVVVELEHQHCKVKSKRFKCRWREPLIITFNDLPLCFRRDNMLTVNVVDVLF